MDNISAAPSQQDESEGQFILQTKNTFLDVVFKEDRGAKSRSASFFVQTRLSIFKIQVYQSKTISNTCFFVVLSWVYVKTGFHGSFMNLSLTSLLLRLLVFREMVCETLK